MTGFKPSVEDDDLLSKQREFELWSKLISAGNSTGQEDSTYNGDPFIYKSGSDGYLFLEVP